MQRRSNHKQTIGAASTLMLISSAIKAIQRCEKEMLDHKESSHPAQSVAYTESLCTNSKFITIVYNTLFIFVCMYIYKHVYSSELTISQCNNNSAAACVY